jgi:hypothetical protein
MYRTLTKFGARGGVQRGSMLHDDVFTPIMIVCGGTKAPKFKYKTVSRNLRSDS